MIFIIILIIIVVFFFLGVLSYMGFFFPLNIKDSLLGPFNLLYREFKGDYDEIDKQLESFQKDLSKYFQSIATFKIYYDNPSALKLKSNARAIYGLILAEKEPMDRIQKFCKKFEDIRYKIIPRISCIHTTVPKTKNYNFNQKVFQMKILPKLVISLGGKAHKNDKEISFVGLVEISSLDESPGKKFIKYAIPYGENTNEYFLTSYPSE